MANKKYGLTIKDLKLGEFYVFYKIRINNTVYDKIVGKIKDLNYSGYRKIGVSFINIEDNTKTSNGLYYYYWINPQFERIEEYDKYLDRLQKPSNKNDLIGKRVKIKTGSIFFNYTTEGTVTDYYATVDNEAYEITDDDGNIYHALPEQIILIETKNQENKEKIMDILEIYRNKQTKRILETTEKKEEEAIKADKEYSEVLAMCDKYGMTMPSTDNFKEVTAKLDKIKIEEDLELVKLNDLLNEVKAQLDLCENYEQKVGVLHIYNILDDNGKVKGE